MSLQRYTAFSADPTGGNPAGVMILERFPSDAEMQAMAAEVGYSETAFAVPGRDGAFTVRYFSPAAEVPFCGHATIALAVALGEATDQASLRLETRVGTVPVSVSREPAGAVVATLTSPKAGVQPLDADRRSELLRALRVRPSDLDPRFPVAVGDSGNLHPIVVLADRRRLGALDYDFDLLRELCIRHRWVTIQVVHRGDDGTWSSRNPFPFGGVREDPATGSAAIALGSYLREQAAIQVPGAIVIEQGRDMGRPGHLTVLVDDHTGPIRVSGTAVQISG
jgi:PhzF family phenazine biosynthesis protein